MPFLNREKLIEEGFKGFDLNAEQKNAIRVMLNGYVSLLLASHVDMELSKEAIRVYVDIIKSAIGNCLNVVEMSRGQES